MNFQLPTMDARPDRLDLRDRVYSPPVRSLVPHWPADTVLSQASVKYIEAGLILDQGKEGACTGFGLACVVNYLLWYRWYLAEGKDGAKAYSGGSVSPRMLYHLARIYDEWPGEDYDGSSCRGALKAWHKHGVCTETLWPYRDEENKVVFIPPKEGWDADAMQRPLGVYYRIMSESVVDMQAAIQEVGAIYVSAGVHSGWSKVPHSMDNPTHDTLPVIPFPGELTGGHAFALVGYNERGFVVQNSWSQQWGMRGFAILTYEDWVQNGTDAWVCGLGVPKQSGGLKSPSYVSIAPSSYHDMLGMAPSSRDRGRSAASVSGPTALWTEEKAYLHTVILENEGRAVSRRVQAENALDAVNHIAYELPKQWIAANPDENAPVNVAIYAHGGLNNEEESITRIRHLAPYFQANGVYPLFLTWHTGVWESLRYILEDNVSRMTDNMPQQWSLRGVVEGISEAKDRMIEIGLGKTFAKPIWTQMKQNAGACIEKGNGGFLLLQALRKLKEDYPNRLKLHVVGHSAGSIILGHLLKSMSEGHDKLDVTTCSLFAPACSVEFANTHYGTLVPKTHIHLLSDERERGDGLPSADKPIYGKSLLYLVSRALDKWEKTPILGLENVFTQMPNKTLWNPQAIDDVGAWQATWQSKGGHLHVVTTPDVSTGVRSIKAAHGCFDNDVATVTATLQRIISGDLQYPVTNLDY
ncbi:MAG: C1 family peptidase [Magnetococcus sp. THC-1_WYH]